MLKLDCSPANTPDQLSVKVSLAGLVLACDEVNIMHIARNSLRNNCTGDLSCGEPVHDRGIKPDKTGLLAQSGSVTIIGFRKSLFSSVCNVMNYKEEKRRSNDRYRKIAVYGRSAFSSARVRRANSDIAAR